jgi:hypothetical protein
MVPSEEYVVFFDDFMGPVATNVPDGWTAAIIDTGCTATQADQHGGIILLDSDANNEGVSFYGPKVIKLDGKKFFMEARFKIEDVSAQTVMFGLTDLAATTNPEDLWTSASTYYLTVGHQDGGNTKFYYRDNAAETSDTFANAGVVVDDTYVTMAFSYNGSGAAAAATCSGYVNGKWYVDTTAPGNIPKDVELAPFFGFLGGTNAGAGTDDKVHLDYIRWSFER